VAQRDKHSKLKVLALVGAGLVFLVVDVLLLTLIVIPLAASTRTGPTGAAAGATKGAELALVLPTRDPRTPWPTRRPTLTATPWLVSPSTPEPPPATPVPAESTLAPATPVPAESSALPQPTLAPATSPQTGSTAPPRSSLAAATPSHSPKTGASALVTSPTPTLRPVAMPSFTPDAGAGLPAETPEPAETPVNASTETPTTVPDETTTATPSVTPPPTPPDTLDDLPDFETFMRNYRNTIAGQPFDVVSLGVDRTNAALPRFVLEVAATEMKDIFAAQSATDLVDYGRRFLDDAQRYLGGAYSAVAVKSTYKTSNSGACASTPAWCDIGAHDEATNTWDVTWTYVRGSYTGGPNTVEAWNTGP
jgi:hypothetical protein